MNSSRRVNNKKEKRPSWEKIVGGWEIENETDWNWMVSFGRKEPRLNYIFFDNYFSFLKNYDIELYRSAMAGRAKIVMRK